MRLLKSNCVSLIIDFQERLMPHMQNREAILDKTKILIKGLQVLEVPLIITEQYTKGLGFTVEPIKSLFPHAEGIEKTAFSCCDSEPIFTSLKVLQKNVIIIAGIEAHVCVLQTAVDLLENGFIPVIVEDCISSRNQNDKKIALRRMFQSGAIITTCESILFELTRFAGNENFKAISRLVK